ncbi:MAG TPA: class I SAM-dependent methyltransferase [Bryobacteraceae bacterium]|jgi:SAM-dependent methyltransferase|nr:class I SAM-dependent methyltransferase [Bryobacteraceae bacterium]
MKETKPEFDALSASYDELLRDPIRDRFSAGTAFFHARKRDLIRAYFDRNRLKASSLSWLDLGCGKGDLLTIMKDDFGQAAGCDPSGGMLEAGNLRNSGIDAREQRDPGQIPFEDSAFDFITAVCVYHHVPPPVRAALTAEVRRVLRPGGTFCIIEHNPWNPATRLIVSRTPVDADAILLRAGESCGLLEAAGFHLTRKEYFLYLPEGLYRNLRTFEGALGWLPLGGQYAVFGQAPA